MSDVASERLVRLGWDAHFEAQWALVPGAEQEPCLLGALPPSAQGPCLLGALPLSAQGPILLGALPLSAQGPIRPARVISENRGIYELGDLEGSLIGELTGRYRHATHRRRELPVTGDWVVVRPSRQGGRATIEGLLERRGLLVRRAAGGTGEQALAANVDVVFIVTSMNADWSPRRLERYVALAVAGNAKAVVLITKTDLATDADRTRIATDLAGMGSVEHIAIDAKHGDLAALADRLSGRTGALLGSSGVGKSTLTNRLLGRLAQSTAAIREEDAKGRHTTTSRHLFELPGGGCLIDTPGMRELALPGEEEGEDLGFAEIAALAEACRFGDCSHQNEPGCRVRAAIDAGTMDRGRVAGYQKLRKEQDAERRRTDPGAAAAAKAKWKHVQSTRRVQAQEESEEEP